MSMPEAAINKHRKSNLGNQYVRSTWQIGCLLSKWKVARPYNLLRGLFGLCPGRPDGLHDVTSLGDREYVGHAARYRDFSKAWMYSPAACANLGGSASPIISAILNRPSLAANLYETGNVCSLAASTRDMALFFVG
jgi:hypothetical protein